MNRSALLATSYLIDQMAGDPEWLPHPVRVIGMLSKYGESALREADDSNAAEFVSGAMLTVGIVTMTYLTTLGIIGKLNQTSGNLGIATEILLGWTCIAARNLYQEADAVRDALANDNIPFARQQLSRIVGRDTEALDETEICRALIETLAESTSDGVIAPIFYMMMGGVPLAMTYKAINTLDSMIGHADARYFYFGKAAARLDDLANYVPARLTALLIVGSAWLLKGYDGADTMRIWRRDGLKHKSPNAGQPESAMAGALRVRVGGKNTYAGEIIHADVIGEEFRPPDLSSVTRALRLASVTALVGVVICIIGASYANKKSRKNETA